jgi:ribosomal protein S18 acetylase RimI-like enzyme
MRTTVRVRAATEDDQPAVMRVRSASWRAAYREIIAPADFDALDRVDVATHTRRYRAGVQAGMRVTIAEAPTGEVIGFCAFGRARLWDKSMPGVPTAPPEPGAIGPGEVYAIYVHPDHWRSGAGSALLDDALGQLAGIGLDPVVLWTFTANGQARAFYERRGFRLDEGRRRFRFDGREGGPDDPEEIRYVRSRPPSPVGEDVS